MTSSSKIIIGAIAVVVIGAGIWLGLGGKSVVGGDNKVLHVHNGGDPSSLDPHKVSGDWENRIVGELFEGLMTEDVKGDDIPGMALSYDVSPNKEVYTFHLRDANWSDGKPVTAHDFVYAYQRLMKPETAATYAFLLFTIKNAEEINNGTIKDVNALGVKAIDDKTLEITLKQPVPFFVSSLTHYTAFPVPTHVVEDKGEDWVKPSNFVSNGSYNLKEWVPGSHVSVVKNTGHYLADQLQIDEAIFYVLEDETAALTRFEAGEFDIVTEFPTDQISRIRAENPNVLHISPQAGLYYYALNYNLKPYNDSRVRKALSMSIDRDLICEQITGTGEIPAYSWVPPNMNNYGTPYSADWAGESYPDKLAAAKKLMRAAGYGDNKRLKMVLRYNTNENHKRIAVAIAGMWKEVYVDVELLNTEVKVHYSDLNNNEFEVARAGWLADYNDASNFLDLLKGGNLYNYGRWRSAEYDRLMEKAAATLDLTQRAKTLYDAEKVAIDNSASIPIYYYVTRNLVAENIQGFEDNVFDVHRVRYMSKQ